MKTAALFVLCALAIAAAEPIHLGTITPRDGILLDANTRLTNWICFAVELVSHSSTNTLSFHTTNSILTLRTIAGLPEGLTTLKLRNICNDRIVSETLTYTVTIQRGVTPVPRAIIVPLPPDLPGERREFALPQKPMPMPNGTNVSYAEGRLYDERSRKGGR